MRMEAQHAVDLLLVGPLRAPDHHRGPARRVSARTTTNAIMAARC